MFNENSALVKAWVKKINQGTYTIEQVPQISNLKEIVEKIIS